MKVDIRDHEVFNSLMPRDVEQYLKKAHWREVKRVPEELVIYELPTSDGRTEHVWLPLSTELGDYSVAMARLVQVVADIRGMSQLQVFEDLQTTGKGDVIRVKSVDQLDAHQNTVPLADGIMLINQARALASASASSVSQKRPVYPSSPAADVRLFLKQLRLAQTEPGSFIVKLVAPIIQDDGKPAMLEGMPESIPFSRKAIMQMMRGLETLRVVAETMYQRGTFRIGPFEDAVPDGVSANLCEALIFGDNVKETRPIEVGVSWSYLYDAPSDLPAKSIAFHPEILGYVQEAAREFRRKNPEKVTLDGIVTHLERQNKTDPGAIRLATVVDGKLKYVRMNLAMPHYDQAIVAHQRRDTVSVTGELRAQGYILRMANVEGFAILNEALPFDADVDA